MTGREKSDGRVVPEGTGNRVRIAKRGGKAATDIERKRSARLPGGTADQPKPHDTLGATVSAGDVTLESVVTYENLGEAFRQVKKNGGAPGPDGRIAVSNAGAQDHRAANATFAFMPIAFWRQLAAEQVGTTPNPGYERLNPSSLVDGDDAFSAIHQLIPCVFLQHALVNSGFA